MFGHTRLITGTIVAAVALVGCGDEHRSSSPTAPSMSSAATANQSGALASRSAESSSPRSGPFHITKDCVEYTGLPGGFCTIVSSNVKEIPVGTRVVYASAATATAVDSDLILDPPGPSHSVASGHVVLDRTVGRGVVMLTAGTGRFTDFTATIIVTHLTGRVWAWDGTYTFGGNGDCCDED